MDKLTRTLLFCALALWCGAYAVAQNQPAPGQMTVQFSAVNRDGAFVTTLGKDDVRVLEDGVPQSIISLRHEANSPVSLALLIDTSGSQEATFPAIKATALTFINSILRAGEDTAAVSSFTGNLKVEQSLTSNLSRAATAIEGVQFTAPPNRGLIVVGKPTAMDKAQAALTSTAIWDAVWLTCEETLQKSPANAKRAIILMSDGWDTFSERKMTEAVARAIKAGVVVYAIGVGDDRNYGGTKKDDLRKLTERTGGKAFFPKKVGELKAAIGEIGQELRNHYVITYVPAEVKAGGSFKSLNIALVNPEKKRERIKLTHQHGYYVDVR